MSATKINFGDVDLIVTNERSLARIEIHRDGKITGLNCETAQLIKFFTDSIDILMEVRK